MAVAMAATPFLNNAATVLIVAPIGHQCNTLVMGPGGYRFIDYPRLGAPLSLIVLVVGTALIAMVWPLAG
jgi:di/tricarboxylate transporter